MKNYGIFEILGPIMVGPSSSHTAGAERLGLIAKRIAGTEILTATFYLHGSFAKTYKGHGTDRALVAGIIGLEANDERIKSSFQIAEDKGISIQFAEADLGDVHPNTVRIDIVRSDNSLLSVTGSSIGGGSIVITEIDGDPMNFTGDYPVIIIKHLDKKGMLSKISFTLAMGNINIAALKVGRVMKGETATTVIETDTNISHLIIDELSKIDGVLAVRAVNIL